MLRKKIAILGSTGSIGKSLLNINSFKKFKNLNKDRKLKIYNNFESFNKIFKKKVDYIMSSIIGLDGLEPTFNSIKYTKKIAIANKESIICGWDLIKNYSLKIN